MNVIKALQQRKSVRAFLDKEVEEDKINVILTAASHAPSGTNTQPWQVSVVTGETKQKLQKQIERNFREGDKGKADYHYYPEEWIQIKTNRLWHTNVLCMKDRTRGQTTSNESMGG